jgi:ferric-dicitrate binding protein FerR (iron transport regulator)
MIQKHLNKKLLTDLFIGFNDPDMNSEILQTDEVKSMMYHQWKNPQEIRTSMKPDLKKLFAKIKERIHPENVSKSANTQFLISEIEDLKLKYHMLRKRSLLAMTIAASLILFISLGSLMIINKNQVFRNTYTENIAPRGQKSHVILPDGSYVYLNSGSMIRYDNHFGKRYRKLHLTGEAYFEVTKNEKLPFIINTDDVEVKVLGTRFNIMAYPEDDIVETIVSEGSVSVTEVHNMSSVLLSANQKATFDKNTQFLLLNDVNPDPYISWKNNILTFDNENFGDVIKKLERWFDVSIQVEGTDSIRDRFTLTIKSESLREVLDLISLTTDIKYTINDSHVTITYN